MAGLEKEKNVHAPYVSGSRFSGQPNRGAGTLKASHPAHRKPLRVHLERRRSVKILDGRMGERRHFTTLGAHKDTVPKCAAPSM